MPDLGNGSDKNSPLVQVPVEVTVSVGKAHPRVSELLNLGKESVLPLDRSIDEPVELFIGDKLIARGELIERDGPHEGQLAVRLTEITPTGNWFET